MSSSSSGTPPPARPAHRVGPEGYADVVGMPIRFYGGPYGGKIIHTTIEEVQKPDLGRKYGQRDSRPVDPPPVVQVRMYEVLDFGTPDERAEEMDVDDIFLPGLVCAAELYPYNPEFEDNPALYPDGCPPPAPIQPTTGQDGSYVLARANVYPPDNLPRRPRVALPRAAAMQGQLHGELYQSAIAVPDIRGSAKRVVYFVFAELQVRLTGHFMLRYTAMHIDWTIQDTIRQPQLAECWGGVFAIYPSKQHPSMRPSSELTNHLSRCGSKLHSRHKARAGRATGPTNGHGTGAGGSKRSRSSKKRKPDEDDDEEEQDEPSDDFAPQHQFQQQRSRPSRRAAQGKNYAEPEVEVELEIDPVLVEMDRPTRTLPSPPQRSAPPPAPPLPSASYMRLPPIGVAIPEHAFGGSARWSFDRERERERDRRWDPPPPAPQASGSRLHGEIGRLHGENFYHPNGGGGGGGGVVERRWDRDEEREEEEERERDGPRRIGWSSSHVRGG
ncbi:hypothetical protein EXIGLDRAFT_734305 [Exidia glandulosa HHB12029]|uniref:Velvet domain-containing protein n=1 Tax=Exidia glandulosa HHB12029 TaxID=1314781 RepID=A0A165B3T4_EXIGL|nr:hypothetical protein EXIGLDRAFT_734305 [Exidia glandulosa HHB12029]